MIEKVSQHSLEAVRSRQLWRDSWTGVTLADNYHVEGYGVDYAARASRGGGLGQRVQHATRRRSPASISSITQHRSSSNSNSRDNIEALSTIKGLPPPDRTRQGGVSAHGHLLTRSVVPMGQKQAEGQVAMDLSHHMHGHRLSDVHFGAAGLVSTPLHDVVSSPTHSPYAPYSAPATKKSRTEDFDL
ncbi:hypothetical protein Purlil1_13537 [Purpureocillium lilacinum]|uniref:Uncharacterized protein n=1 Tax=Purpureocillium lilacinum TaxID=33203 RepID=A0ABR0BDZ1_PURLI|nr:hypothetical protein Purlil1_13537 [Purpureocillium lilacinum]